MKCDQCDALMAVMKAQADTLRALTDQQSTWGVYDKGRLQMVEENLRSAIADIERGGE